MFLSSKRKNLITEQIIQSVKVLVMLLLTFAAPIKSAGHTTKEECLLEELKKERIEATLKWFEHDVSLDSKSDLEKKRVAWLKKKEKNPKVDHKKWEKLFESLNYFPKRKEIDSEEELIKLVDSEFEKRGQFLKKIGKLVEQEEKSWDKPKQNPLGNANQGGKGLIDKLFDYAMTQAVDEANKFMGAQKKPKKGEYDTYRSLASFDSYQRIIFSVQQEWKELTKNVPENDRENVLLKKLKDNRNRFSFFKKTLEAIYAIDFWKRKQKKIEARRKEEKDLIEKLESLASLAANKFSTGISLEKEGAIDILVEDWKALKGKAQEEKISLEKKFANPNIYGTFRKKLKAIDDYQKTADPEYLIQKLDNLGKDIKEVEALLESLPADSEHRDRIEKGLEDWKDIQMKWAHLNRRNQSRESDQKQYENIINALKEHNAVYDEYEKCLNDIKELYRFLKEKKLLKPHPEQIQGGVEKLSKKVLQYVETPVTFEQSKLLGNLREELIKNSSQDMEQFFEYLSQPGRFEQWESVVETIKIARDAPEDERTMWLKKIPKEELNVHAVCKSIDKNVTAYLINDRIHAVHKDAPYAIIFREDVYNPDVFDQYRYKPSGELFTLGNKLYSLQHTKNKVGHLVMYPIHEINKKEYQKEDFLEPIENSVLDRIFDDIIEKTSKVYQLVKSLIIKEKKKNRYKKPLKQFRQTNIDFIAEEEPQDSFETFVYKPSVAGGYVEVKKASYKNTLLVKIRDEYEEEYDGHAGILILEENRKKEIIFDAHCIDLKGRRIVTGGDKGIIQLWEYSHHNPSATRMKEVGLPSYNNKKSKVLDVLWHSSRKVYHTIYLVVETESNKDSGIFHQDILRFNFQKNQVNAIERGIKPLSRKDVPKLSFDAYGHLHYSCGKQEHMYILSGFFSEEESTPLSLGQKTFLFFTACMVIYGVRFFYLRYSTYPKNRITERSDEKKKDVGERKRGAFSTFGTGLS